MFENYGLKRVVQPANTIPILAWKLDSRRILRDNELLLNVKKIHVEQTNLRQIIQSVGNDTEKIKQRIIGIVNDRGKLHNPFTDTGGTIYGEVEKVGSDYTHRLNLKHGDKIVVVTSATMLPLYIEEIKSIDFIYGCLEVTGHCILYPDCPVIKKQPGGSLEILMLGFEESASLFHIFDLAKGKKNFLITGNDALICMMYAQAIRKATAGDCYIVCVLYPQDNISQFNNEMSEALSQGFDKIHIAESSITLPIAERLLQEEPNLFDICVNCADMPGAEIINVLATRQKGTIFFTNLINNYQIALFFTESVGRDVNIMGAYGYADGYEDFTVLLLEETNDIMINLSRLLHRIWESLNGNTVIYSGEYNNKALVNASTYDFIYESDIMKSVVNDIIKAAKYNCPALIEGETGVGKEKVAQLIHSNSIRKSQVCISVNCGAIPENLMEMEFFGYEKGAFTGAEKSGKIGFFEMADHGILFLDEIGELTLNMQVKLLRVLQEQEFYRIGGTKLIHVDVRVIASTNRDLRDFVNKGLFRSDLYYRLAVILINVPPLRDRRTDIVPLVEYFVERFNKEYDKNKRINDEGVQLLLEYSWPGNIRELDNIIQRLLINSSHDRITASEVSAVLYLNNWSYTNNQTPVQNTVKKPAIDEINFTEFVDSQEKEFLRQQLALHGTTRKTAIALGISQSKLMRRKKKFGL